MRAKILELLREKGDFVSGQQLCDCFGVTRTAVWKAVSRLREEGYKIEAVQNKGYCLVESGAESEMYTQNELTSRMRTRWAGKPVCFYESLDSTNSEAKRLAEAGAAHGTLVVADMQTAGKGRRGHSWSCQAGVNSYFTILLRPDLMPDAAPMLTLVMAHAVAAGIRRETGVEVGIKWPNDIVIQGRKVCGILTEMSAERDYIQHVVIGAGINVRAQEFAPEIADRAIALDTVCDRPTDRSRLLVAIMELFEEDYEQFVRTGSLASVKDAYQELLVNRGREVCVLDPAGEYRGVARGINDMGELLVEMSDGTAREVFAGEVSVRGVYGYV
ncbi:MAG: biotin--[acetyl-CoA-carboxylase] ligase [Clostridium sp.]|nr:biotin--[acetyl-CoA-carboxylase] ligase [Acetatifactor muris]MCM1527871.1 biotin--[acetyl-CoA-carboxylase] ligase [Bacteroides sp.]MCM1563914.1 biotin--[acetyl-CoA-carboxylase] ligase [Clostridium sp.]